MFCRKRNWHVRSSTDLQDTQMPANLAEELGPITPPHSSSVFALNQQSSEALQRSSRRAQPTEDLYGQDRQMQVLE